MIKEVFFEFLKVLKEICEDKMKLWGGYVGDYNGFLDIWISCSIF